MSTKMMNNFVSTVAPLYSINGWLGSSSYADAYDKVYRITESLYRDVVDHAADMPDSNYKVSTGRVYVEYSPGHNGDLPEIEVGLSLEHVIPDDDGVWTDIRDYDTWD